MSRLKVPVAAFGNAGDVFPLIAVAREMKARGHDITFIANAHFAQPGGGRDARPVGRGTGGCWKRYPPCRRKTLLGSD